MTHCVLSSPFYRELSSIANGYPLGLEITTVPYHAMLYMVETDIG